MCIFLLVRVRFKDSHELPNKNSVYTKVRLDLRHLPTKKAPRKPKPIVAVFIFLYSESWEKN